MSYQSIFKRYELKYLLTPEQKAAVLKAMDGHMVLDKYGRTSIRNIYYDTDDYRLIRRSIEKPAYKEKLRIRSYGRAEKEDKIFVELKKKYDGIVYKRRLSMREDVAISWIEKVARLGLEKENYTNSQIASEIEYMASFYGLKPKMFISYEREAFFVDEREDSFCDESGKSGTSSWKLHPNTSDFRVTFDEDILCRSKELSLDSEVYGDLVLPAGMTLMEIKTPGGIPLWMTKVLTEEKIYKTSFSKYGQAYTKYITS